MLSCSTVNIPVAIKIKPQMVIESQMRKKKMEAEKAKIAAEREAEKKAAELAERDEESVEEEERNEDSVKVKPEKKDKVTDWEDIPDF
jgi:hypothetical protein